MECGTLFTPNFVKGFARVRGEPPNPRLSSSIAKRSRPPNKAGREATTVGKKIVGRKRHLVVDTLGLMWALVITPANVQDGAGGKLVMESLRQVLKFPKVIWADQAYRSLVSFVWVQWLWFVEIVSRPSGRFEIQPKRWIVERTFGWLNRSRRLAKSYERTIESDHAFVQIALIHLMIKRLAH